MLDSDLANLYGVEPKVMNQAVKRNIVCFLSYFMFQLTNDEWKALRSQIVTSNNNRGGIEKNDKRVNEIIIALNNLIVYPPESKKIGFNAGDS